MPVVPSDWAVLPFEQAADVISDKGKRMKQGSYLLAGKIPVIDQGQDPIGGYTDDEDMAFDDELPVILFGDHTRSLKYVDKRFAVGAEGVKILRPREGYVPKFFYYLLRSLEIPSRGYSRHFQFLRKFHLPLAPEEQQKRIVAEIEKQFSRLDEAVANLKRVKANLKRYKASVLKVAVEGKLTEDWRKQHPDVEPAEKLLERIIAERRAEWSGKGTYRDQEASEYYDLPRLPPGWVWTTSLQVFKEVKDGTHDTPKYQENGVPFITQKHIKPAGLIFSDFKLISEVDHEQFYRRSNPERGDILVSMIGVNRGQSCIVSTDAIFSIKNVGLFKPNHFLTSSKFLQLYFSSLVGQKLILRSSKGGAQPFIGLTELRAWPLPLPPLKEQHWIVAEVERRLSVIDELEAAVEANLTRADRLRQSILSNAFAGKLVCANISQSGERSADIQMAKSLE